MKNLLKVLLVLAFSTTAFGDMGNMNWPAPDTVTTDAIKNMSSDKVNGWLASLTADQYNMLKPEVQNWLNAGLTTDQYNMLKPEVQTLVTVPASN